jgi:hypothetical protein
MMNCADCGRLIGSSEGVTVSVDVAVCDPCWDKRMVARGGILLPDQRPKSAVGCINCGAPICEHTDWRLQQAGDSLAVVITERDKLRTAIRTASDLLHASFGKPGKLVAKAAGEARKILREAVPIDPK